MRRSAERVYGVPPEQVLGSSLKTKVEVRDGKPLGIHQHNGRLDQGLDEAKI